jgi:AcrR family transcriptional regulator
MGRPRKISDDALLSACGRVIGQHGPGFTLAQVAAEAGVAVGTVSGRFGSKRGLLLAMTEFANAGAAGRMHAAAAAHTDPIAAVTAAVLVTAEGVDDRATTTNHLAQLGVDLADPALRAGVTDLRVLIHGVLTSLFAAADLPGAPPPQHAARIIAAMAHGAILDWALRPTGRLADRLREDIEAVAGAWRLPASRPSRSA